MANFTHVHGTVNDCTGTVYITDMNLQDGSLASGWGGHVSEIKWTQDGD